MGGMPVLSFTHFIHYLSKERRKIFIGIWIVAMILLFMPFSKESQIRLLDVGQGDGLLIRVKSGSVISIDGGSHEKDNLADKVLLPALRQVGSSKIDFAIITHLDRDHYSGILELLHKPRNYINTLVLPQNQQEEAEALELQQLANQKSITVIWLKEGDCIKGKSFQIQCLLASKDKSLDKNQRSLCLDIVVDGIHLLDMGDASTIEEERLIHQYPHYHCDILKVNHHGSKSSSSDLFIKSVRPKIALISCGRKNRYGHPHQEVLKRLNESLVVVYRTDQLGEIQVGIGKRVWIRSYQSRKKIYFKGIRPEGNIDESKKQVN